MAAYQDHHAGTLPNQPSPEACMLFKFIVHTVIIGVFCIFGFIGNTVSFIVLWQERSNSAMTFLLQALTIGDIMVIWMLFIGQVMPNMAYIVPLLQNCTVVCKYVQAVTDPLLFLGQICVVWFTLITALNRYLVLCKPAQAASLTSVDMTKKQVVITLSAAVILTLPLATDSFVVLHYQSWSGSNVTETLSENKWYRAIYRHAVLIVVVFIFPTLCFLLLIYKLAKVLHSVHRLRRALATNYKAQNTDMTRVILTLCLTLVICYMPITTQKILEWIENTPLNQNCGFLHFYLDGFTKMFIALNSSMKVVIYCLFAQRFWETLKVCFCRGTYKTVGEGGIFGGVYQCGDMSEMTLISHVDSRN